MSDETTPANETTNSFTKKENRLPIIAIAVSGVALLASLFTVGVATAQENHAPDRQAAHSQQMSPEQNGQVRHGEGRGTDAKGMRGQNNNLDTQAGTPEMNNRQQPNQAPQQQDGNSISQQMPKMNGQTGAS